MQTRHLNHKMQDWIASCLGKCFNQANICWGKELLTSSNIHMEVAHTYCYYPKNSKEELIESYVTWALRYRNVLGNYFCEVRQLIIIFSSLAPFSFQVVIYLYNTTRHISVQLFHNFTQVQAFKSIYDIYWNPYLPRCALNGLMADPAFSRAVKHVLA